MSRLDDSEIRQRLLKTFNERFYVLLPGLAENNLYESPVCSDVHEAIAKALEYFALYDIQHPKRHSIHVCYPVTTGNPNGDEWVTIPIGPAWRLCSPTVQQIVEDALVAKDGRWVVNVLLDGDVASFEAAIAST